MAIQLRIAGHPRTRTRILRHSRFRCPRRLSNYSLTKANWCLDPFVGSGTTLVAAEDSERNSVGFRPKRRSISLLSEERLTVESSSQWKCAYGRFRTTRAIYLDYLQPESVSLIWTSPPYSNLLNRKRRNKSRRNRKNEQLGKVEQYSQDPRDLGTMRLEEYTQAMGEIFEGLLPLLSPKAHCVINVPDMWWDNKRITIHIALVEEMRRRGYELRNTIILG